MICGIKRHSEFTTTTTQPAKRICCGPSEEARTLQHHHNNISVQKLTSASLITSVELTRQLDSSPGLMENTCVKPAVAMDTGEDCTVYPDSVLTSPFCASTSIRCHRCEAGEPGHIKHIIQ
ncbi:uncharacterized protein LOC135467323 [Liolophura sinensis]|uniref:uncharacterized protein LOC135467323 n=1 Tax=Liolophura sinensis TaxID=3198878 RepID=UPI0031593AC9